MDDNKLFTLLSRPVIFVAIELLESLASTSLTNLSMNSGVISAPLSLGKNDYYPKT
jgi:hypothetical protein